MRVRIVGRLTVSLAGILGVMPAALTSEPAMPLPSGTYAFQHRFAEHRDLPSIRLEAWIEDGRIRLTNHDRNDVFPRGLIAEGMIVWHAASRQWIIAAQPEDATAIDVGGCSDGPEVVDLQRKIYWTC
ncbi:hypothetical protein FB548_0075 [Pseudoxanthomonas sp. 3HH-4]|uniref:hypothetical protein n=1 Tax=Pseudoxanthomonas sp. 3HH-4 TaxID=1690214 RepID=UPI00114E3C24|nr:hypothetical protein [Pseudoxanthomonas sp. 3HH-4]TQM16707.1 hypothetical protein FB548_0075 [Pseudoxanthomonas sp. 3HH-4]